MTCAPRFGLWWRWSVIAAGLFTLIIIPFVLFEDTITSALQDVSGAGVNTWILGAIGVVTLGLDVVLPVPSSLLSALLAGALGAVPALVVIWVGLSFGSILGYGMGRVAGYPMVRRLVGRDQIRRAVRLMARHGPVIVALTRAIPVLAEAVALSAGALRWSLPKYLAISALSNLGLAAVYALAVQLVQGSWAFAAAFAAAVALPGLGYLILRALRFVLPNDSAGSGTSEGQMSSAETKSES